MKKRPPLEKQQQQQQQHHGRSSRRWLKIIPILCSLLVACVCCLVTAARFTRTGRTSRTASAGTTATTAVAAAAAFLRRPTGLQRKQAVHPLEIGVSYGATSSEPDSSPSSLSLWKHHDQRMLLQSEDEANNASALVASSKCSESCCAPFIVKAATTAAAAAAAACPSSRTSRRSLQEAPAESGLPAWLQWVLMVFCIALSALFSGLTLGMMGLDLSGLEIVMSGDNPKQAEQARLLYPIRKKGNLLLCTLVLGNVAVNALLSILIADKFGGTIGFLTSTFIIVIFGEITPQAACQRYSLQVGSRAVPLVRLIMFLLLPATYPLAWCLDKALGKELATTYSNAEMLKLLAIHVREDVMDPETAAVMGGALRYKSMLVKEVMTTMDKTFMLSSEDKLNFETIARIFKTGYSRIPVYKVSKNNVIGLLFVKDLIFIDPEDNTRLEDFVNIFGRALHVVWPDDSLGDVLRELKKGKSHMALVRDVNNEDDQQDPYYEIKGIVTLEDIIEEILGEEIVDETDAFVNNSHTQSVNPLPRQDGGGRGSIVEEGSFRWGALRLLDSKLVDETLSHDETKAVVAHLSQNYARALGRDLLHTDNHQLLLTENQLYRLVATTPVSLLPTAAQEIGQEIPSSEDLLYEKGVPNDYCTIILSGKVTVLVGADNFRSDVSSWCVLAADAMTGLGTSSGAYKPDFSAYVSAGPCRCLRISRAKFSEAVDSSALERQESSHVRKNSDGGGGGGSSISSVAKLNSKTVGSHVRKSSDGGGGSSNIGSGAKSNSKTIGTGTVSTSGGAIVLGGNATGGTSSAEGTITGGAMTSAAATTATSDGTSAALPWGSSKKQRIFAALKVAAGEVPPAQAVSPPPPVSSSTPPPPRRTRSAPTSTDAPNTTTPLNSTAGPDNNTNKKDSHDK